MSKWPNRKELDSVLKDLEGAEGTLHLPADATPVERFRWDICQQFVKIKRQKGYKQTELAELIGVDKSDVHRILHHRIDQFSTDRLLGYLSKLKSDLKLKVS